MTTREYAIVRSVIYASLFDYPLTLDELHQTLIESDQTPSEILAVYDGSERLQAVVAYRDGFFFPAGRDDLVAERRRREARSRSFLERHATLLRLLCAVPFTRLVALSGSVAHLNLEEHGDLDLFIVTRGHRVWTVTVAVLLLAKLLGQRRVVCANFVMADSHLRLEEQDVFAANRVIHLKPLIGEEILDELLAANPFVTRFYPNGGIRPRHARLAPEHSRVLDGVKAALELALRLPSPLIEAVCRRLYAWHLGRRAGVWRSPEQVLLGSDYLELHIRSHRHSVFDRFEAAVDLAVARAERAVARPAAARGRH